MEVVAIVVSSVGVTAGLITLGLVLRNELRERRASGPILWDFHRYGTVRRNDTGALLEVGELVQFGRQPTRVSAYVLHGFKVRQEDGYRLRKHVKAEDTLPLYLDDVDPDDAWLTVAHFPRDDRRWLIVEAVPLEPASDSMMDRLDGSRTDGPKAPSRSLIGGVASRYPEAFNHPTRWSRRLLVGTHTDGHERRSLSSGLEEDCGRLERR